MLEYSSYAEISYFYRSVLIHENILCLQVSMQDLPIVDVFYCQSHLHEPVQNLILAIADFTYLFLVCYFGIEITTVSIVHNNAETAFVHE